MTSKLSPKPRKARKPETVLRELRNTLHVAKLYNNLGNYRVDVNIRLTRAHSLLSELRASLRRSLPPETGAGKR